MVKTSKMIKKAKSCFTLENLIGLILAILVLFEVPVEQSVKNTLNSPPGMILSLVILLLLFVFFNPVVAILFLIYLYECVKNTGINLGRHIPKSVSDIVTKNAVMQRINENIQRRDSDKVELNTIQRMAPLVTKRENPKASFEPKKDPVPYEAV